MLGKQKGRGTESMREGQVTGPDRVVRRQPPEGEIGANLKEVKVSYAEE